MTFDPNKVYGAVPESFSHRVQYTLHRCEKEETKPMKRKPVVAILITVLCLAMTTTAVAAVLSRTTEFFSLHYGGHYREELESGMYIPGGQTTTLNGVTFTLDDAVISNHVTEFCPEDMEQSNEEIVRSMETLAFWATGTISVAEGENLVLMSWDEYTVNDPAGYVLYYGDLYPAAPEGAPTYAEIAKEKEAVIRKVKCVPNGIINEETGEFYPADMGYTVIPQTDGTVQFSVEIPGSEEIPLLDSYQLSLYIATEDVDLDGNPIEGTRQRADWIVTLVPEKAE